MPSEYNFQQLIDIYQNSDYKTIITDPEFNIIWKNSKGLPNKLNIDKFETGNRKPLELPIKKCITLTYREKRNEITRSSAYRIQPLFENGEVAGYLISVFNCTDVELLSQHSGLFEINENMIINVKKEMGGILSTYRRYHEKNGEGTEPLELERAVRANVIRGYAAMANYDEMHMYLNDLVGKGVEEFAEEAIIDICERVKERADANGYIFESNISSYGYIYYNASRLLVVISNLVANAYQYNSKDEKICKLSFIDEDGTSKLIIEDNGDGMSEEVIKAVGEPFMRNNNLGNGERLGLTIAKLYCKKYKAKMEFESELGKYTKVIMTFTRPDHPAPQEFHASRLKYRFKLDAIDVLLTKGMDQAKWF